MFIQEHYHCPVVVKQATTGLAQSVRPLLHRAVLVSVPVPAGETFFADLLKVLSDLLNAEHCFVLIK